MRTLPSLVMMLTAFAAASAQSQPAALAFEVVSLRRNTSGSTRSDWDRSPSGRVTYVNVTLQRLIRDAYDVLDGQIVGGPAWLDAERFDVIAMPPPGVPAEQGNAMMRALLAERFRLVTHSERREQAVYALVRVTPDSLGPKLRLRPDCADRPAGVDDSGKNPCGGFLFGPGRVTVRGMGIGALASHLSAERLVLDRTELSGDVDLDLEWTPDQMPRGDAEVPPGLSRPRPDGPSLFSALQEQLGLRLQPARASVDVLVIDRVERPTEM